MRPFILLLTILLISINFLSCENSKEPMTLIESGISKTLAEQRKANIDEVKYNIKFTIPNQLEKAINGENTISLNLKNTDSDLVFDFRNEAESVSLVKANGKEIPPQVENEHVVIPKEYLKKGANEITIHFTAGEQALNRNKEFLYTLFVPANASTAFPCFDQPNIKAKYKLDLTIPSEWVTCANYPLIEKKENENVTTYHFEETLPIPTYLFAFAAGKFQKISTTHGGRKMTMYHRETDEDKVTNNAITVFDLHAKALDWLEDYTGIPYPFEKFDFVLVPAFQYGGMEHVGAIFYRQRSLFLEESATVNQKMSRNSLIAHETAHMWFGDLVTMDWFNDVWLKEVFANFMAAKMVNPNFPEINHDLRFVARHHPAAYSEDRSLGTHPIQQKLENLNQAGMMYGRIIYQKAPVVMNQLEEMMGKEKMQEGLQEYLKTFSFGNATWDDLIAILDKKIDMDLKTWSQAWVKESGMPHYEAQLKTENGKIANYNLSLKNKSSGGNIWSQSTAFVFSKNNRIERKSLIINDKEMDVDFLKGKDTPDFILPNGSQSGYGYFELDKKSQSYLLENIYSIDDEIIKFVAWQSLFESMLRGKIEARDLMNTILKSLPHEKEILGLSARLNYLEEIYWGFLSVEEQQQFFPTLGKDLWALMEKSKTKDIKKNLYNTFVSIAQSEEDVNVLFEVWKKTKKISGLKLSENDFTTLAYELAVRNYKDSDNVLQEQLKNITNPDRKVAMEFIIPALSNDVATRDAFFEKLKAKENRQKEPWVQRALSYLHHPLRANAAEKYILPSLELVQELQKTNGIFFPKGWTSTILNGHRSAAAAQIVNEFVKGLPEDYPNKLKNKILQSADRLSRRASIQD